MQHSYAQSRKSSILVGKSSNVAVLFTIWHFISKNRDSLETPLKVTLIDVNVFVELQVLI